MYFIPHNNKFYSFIAHISSFYRYLITLSLLAFILLLWFFFIYLPLTAYIDNSFAKLIQLRKQCQQIERTRKNCQKLQHSLQFTKTQINALEKIPQNSFQSNLLLILEQAKKNGLLLKQYTMNKTKTKQWVAQTNADFIFTGKLSPIMNFLNQLSKINCLIGSDYLLIKKIDDDSFQLTIIFTITLYNKN